MNAGWALLNWTIPVIVIPISTLIHVLHYFHVIPLVYFTSANPL